MQLFNKKKKFKPLLEDLTKKSEVVYEHYSP